MHNFSENWRHLKSILSGYAIREQRPEVVSYEDYQHAKALSAFLTHAELATPALNRETVEAILSGRQSWPNTSGLHCTNFNVSLSELEELGLVAFYAGWCTTYCDIIKDVEDVDPSVIPLVQAVTYLKDIRFGRNGCIQPHFICPKDELEQLLKADFGEQTTAKQLLPELVLYKGAYSLLPDNHNFSSLISTQLWLALRKILSSEDAFTKWMLCSSVNCSWAMPVFFEQLEYSEREEFNRQLVSFMAKDATLGLCVGVFTRQTINQDGFSRIIRPIRYCQNITIDDEGCSTSTTHSVESTKPALVSLKSAYPVFKADETLNNLRFVLCDHGLGHHHRQTDVFYSWLLSSAINASIRIEGQQVIFSGLAEELLRLADSRPILKYILFILLPEYQHPNYLIFLLAQPASSDVALYYLAKQKFGYLRDGHATYIHNLEEGYQQLVCYTYVCSTEKEPNFINRVLNVLELLGKSCDLKSSDFSKTFEYRFLINFLGSLKQHQVLQLGETFAKLPAEIVEPSYRQPAQHYRYVLGFWLIDHLENTGTDPAGEVSRSLRESMQEYYSAEFSANLTEFQSLEPSTFFATLPWNKLVPDTVPRSILRLSDRCNGWQQALAFENKHSFKMASAIRHYLLVLMCMGRPKASSPHLYKVATRVQEIVRLFGFASHEKFVPLFGGGFSLDSYTLWEEFCSYTNVFQDDLYEDFVERCVPSIPLDHLFILLEKCSVIARAQKLQIEIGTRQSEDLGMIGLEQAFVSACDSGNSEIASQLLKKAQDILSQKYFSSTTNHHAIRIRKVWQSYEFKWQLLEALQGYKSDPAGFEKAAHEFPIPHKRSDSSHSTIDRGHYEECEHFRRQIIASAFCETDPEKCIQIMEQLYKETKHVHHGYMLFDGHCKLYAKNNDRIRLKNALAFFLSSLDDADPRQMREYWVATILEVYQQIESSEIDSFWVRLAPEQQVRLEILRPYCRALIGRGETTAARKVIGCYRNINQLAPEELGIEDLVDELQKVEPDAPSMSELIQQMNEGSQRTVIQLRKHYSQIVSQDFEAYVDIVRPGQPLHEYLKDAVLDVANEVVLRKQNLQVQSALKLDKANLRITKEDLINDWFVSLFDKRMAEARVGFRDQKRGGQSASGASPGEIDGFITCSKNKRVALFEAFRLFSLDTTVIFELSGQDSWL